MFQYSITKSVEYYGRTVAHSSKNGEKVTSFNPDMCVEGSHKWVRVLSLDSTTAVCPICNQNVDVVKVRIDTN